VAIPDRVLRGGRPVFPAGSDPVGDALAYGTGPAVLVPGARNAWLVSTRDERVRAAAINANGLSETRSVLKLYQLGGTDLERSRSGDATAWLAVGTGFPEDVTRAQGVPVALVALGADGAVKSVATDVLKDDAALPGGVAIATHGTRVTVVYPRLESKTTMGWMVQQAECTGGR
jgi:hypothetical protein